MCGAKLFDLEVVVLGITAVAFGFTVRISCSTACTVRGVIHSYNMTAASVHDLNYLKDVRWQYHDCLMLGDKGYLCAEVQKNLFEVANISLEVP